MSTATTPESQIDVFQQMWRILYGLPNALVCYTNGSRIRNRVGAAFSIDNLLHNFRFRNSASVFTAELQAIFQRFQIIFSNPAPLLPHVLIISDSRSSLLLHPPYSKWNLILLSALQEIIHSVNFVWVPSHKRIQGNAEVNSPPSLPPDIHVFHPSPHSLNPTSTCISALSWTNAGLLFGLTKPTSTTTYPN